MKMQKNPKPAEDISEIFNLSKYPTSMNYLTILFTFSARKHIAYMLSALYAIARPSVCLSVRHTGVSYKNG